MRLCSFLGIGTYVRIQLRMQEANIAANIL